MPVSLEDANGILGSVFPDWVNQLNMRVTEINGDTVHILMPADDRFMRLGESVSGQAVMALVDTAMVVTLANALGGFRPVATIGLSFSFMRPMAAGDVSCVVSVLRLGRTLAFCRAVLSAADGRDAIHATGTYSIPAEQKS